MAYRYKYSGLAIKVHLTVCAYKECLSSSPPSALAMLGAVPCRLWLLLVVVIVVAACMELMQHSAHGEE